LRKEDVLLYTPGGYYCSNELTEDEMGRHTARMGERCLFVSPEGKMLNDLGVEEMIILKCFLKKYDRRLWTESVYNQPPTPTNTDNLCKIKNHPY
jgi:hypothetical protein